MRARPVILAWWLLLGATVLMAAAAWWLLGREADRVESLAAGTLANRTASVAESIDLLMEEVRDGVAEGLLTVREVSEPRFALAEMVESNPYVAVGYYFRGLDAVTVWFGKRGELPTPGSILETAGSRTLEYPWSLPEFESADSGDVAISPPNPLLAQEQLAQSKAPSDNYAQIPELEETADEQVLVGGELLGNEAQQQQEFYSQNFALKQQRAAVRKVNVDNRLGYRKSGDDVASQVDVAGALPADLGLEQVQADESDLFEMVKGQRAEQSLLRRGWINYELDEKELWMAWASLPDGVDYIGAWLDEEAVMAELSKAISLSQQDGLRFRLVDPKGRTVGEDYASKMNSNPGAPELTLAVGSALPQWRIETFRANGANTFGSSFRFVGGLFIGGLSLTILIGSAVLIWQARRDALDAQRKTTFVANVSHELKTPLTSIRLFADMLHDGRVKEERKQREYLQRMLNETQRLTRLVNNVLDFSRLDRGQRRAKFESMDLGATVAEIIEAQTERLSTEGLSVDYIAPESPVHAEVDRDALEQILLNLLDNAAKYAASGKRAEVLLEGDNAGWSLHVNDFGPGIPAAERKQVFAAFHRSDDRLTSERPGCGLGLSIAARLAQELGGVLTLEENQPTGCAFILKVPG
ncbi:MAG: sensor histidine kinase [Opitutales bacterium]